MDFCAVTEVLLVGCSYWNIEMHCVDNTIPLKLYPDTICVGAWEGDVELHLRRTVCNEWVRMHHVDEIIAGGQHVTPGAKIFFKPVAGAQGETHLRIHSCDRLSRSCRQFDLEVFTILRRIIAREGRASTRWACNKYRFRD